MANAFIRISLVLWVVFTCPQAFCQTQIQHQIQADQDTLIQIQGPVLPFTVEVKKAGETVLDYKTTANHYPVEWLYLPANLTSGYDINLRLAKDDQVAAQHVQFLALPTDNIHSKLYIDNQRLRHQANDLDGQLQVLSQQHSDSLLRDLQVASLMFYQGQFNNSIEQLNALSDEKLSSFSVRLVLQKYRLLTDAYISLNQFHQALEIAVDYLQLWRAVAQKNSLSKRGLAEGQLAVSYVLSHIEIDDQAMQPFAHRIACQSSQMPATSNQTLAQRTSFCLLNLVANDPSLEDLPHLAFIYYRNTWLYFNAINDHKKTLDTAQQALVLGQKIWEDSHNAIFHQFLGHSHYRNGELSKGLAEYRLSLEGFLSTKDHKPPYYSAYKLQSDTADSYFNIAFLYNKIGEFKRATSYFERSANLRESIGNRAGALVAKSYQASALRETGNLNNAIEVHSQVIADLSKQNYYYLTTSIELANDYVAQQSWQQAIDIVGRMSEIQKIYTPQKIDLLLIEMRASLALNHTQRAIEIEQQLRDVFAASIERAGQNSYLLRHLQLLGLQIKKSSLQGDLASLDRHYQMAQQLIASAKVSLRSTLAFTQATHKIFQDYIVSRLAITSDTDQQALTVIFESLDQYYTQNYSSALNALQLPNKNKGNAKVKTPVSFAQSLWQQKVAAEKRAIVSTTAEQKKLAIDNAALLHDRISVYSLQQQDQLKPITQVDSPSIRQQLDTNDVIGMYFYSPQKSFVLFMHHSGLQLKHIPSTPVLEQLLNDISSGKGLMTETANKDLRFLLPDSVQSNEPTKLYMVADSPYDKLPLDLINIATNQTRYRPARTEYEFIQILSPSVFFSPTLRREWQPQTDRQSIDIAVFANPIIDRSNFGDSSDASQYNQWRSGLSNLPYTQIEAQRIQRLFQDKSVEVYTGEHATNASLMSKPVREAAILHIATHGYYDPEAPEIVAFATTSNQQNDDTAHDFVTLTELQRQPFNSQLVVISGCETLLGQDYSGFGMNGLSRNFVMQGAGSVIGTLWKIPDKPTAQFMAYFYQALKDNNGDSSKALYQAKNRLASNGRYRNPLYWAGFVLMSSHHQFEKVSM